MRVAAARPAIRLPDAPMNLRADSLVVRKARLGGVIISRYHDNMIRTQISVDEQLYERAKDVARRHGISLAELVRRGLEQVLASEPTDRPWMAYAGAFDGGAGDSASVDEVVYGRDDP